MAELYLGDDDDNGADDDKSPPLDDSDEEKQCGGDEAGAVAVADGVNVIVTPSHERVVTTSGDEAFIKGSDESDVPVSGGHITDDD